MRSADPLPDRMLRLDPVSPNSHLIHSIHFFVQGRFARAADLAAVFFEMAPGASLFVFWYAVMLAYAGRARESQDVLGSLPETAGDDAPARMGLMLSSTLSADCDRFGRLMTPDFEAYARRDLQWSWHVAAFYARLGHTELALTWLTNAVDRGFGNAQFIRAIDPFLESLRGDPRFDGLVRRAQRIQDSIED